MTYIFLYIFIIQLFRMCAVTCDLCVLLFMFRMCLIYLISFRRFVCSRTEIINWHADSVSLSSHKNVLCYCTWVLPVGEFHICKYSAQLYSGLTWWKFPEERLADLKPLLLLRFWCVCPLRETSFSDVSTIWISSVRIIMC